MQKTQIQIQYNIIKVKAIEKNIIKKKMQKVWKFQSKGKDYTGTYISTLPYCIFLSIYTV